MAVCYIGALVLASCSQNPAAPHSQQLRPSAALVSAPFAAPRTSPASAPARVTYVSMPPGTFPGGAAVTIRHLRGTGAVSGLMVDGGFDPVAIAAQTGDTLLVTAARLRGDTTGGYVRVPSGSIPKIVRISPANQKTNVSLNDVIVVVFSEPMVGKTLIGAIQVTLAGVAISGTVVPGAGDTLTASFKPASPLAPATTYDVSVSTAAQAQNGDSLAAPVQTSFTTAGPPDGGCVHDCWAALDSVPDVIASWGIGTVNGILYQVAAYNNGRQGVAAYDPVSNHWTAKALMPTNMATPTVGVLNGLIYVMGGQGGPDYAEADVEAYDPATDHWTPKAPLPIAGAYSTLGVLQGSLFVARFGGGDVAAYDPTADRWSMKARLPGSTGVEGGGVLNGVLYAVRGSVDRKSVV
jgi:hypothetical protein